MNITIDILMQIKATPVEIIKFYLESQYGYIVTESASGE